MAELVYAFDLKSNGEIRAGSTPALGTKGVFFLCGFSRGEVIITQKEAKGEYEKEGNWFWNRNTANGMPAEYGNQEIEPHVFDNTNGSGVPARMTNFGATYSSNSYCTNEVMTSDGDLLMGGSQIFSQISCTPNTGNVGNYYGWYTATAGNDALSGAMKDSICPKGWQLPNGDTSDVNKSFASITLTYVGISDNKDVSSSVEQSLRESAASFIRGGNYYYNDASRTNRGSHGYYWSSQASSSTSAYVLHFASTFISPRHAYGKGYGFAVRCVAR